MPQAIDWNQFITGLVTLIEYLKTLFGPTPTPKQQALLSDLEEKRLALTTTRGTLPKCPNDDLHCHCCEVLAKNACALADLAVSVQLLQECCDCCKP